MPELPEVESFRRIAHRVAVGRRIELVLGVTDGLEHPLTAGDPIVLEDEAEAPGSLARALVGKWVIGTSRRGKYAWLELEGELALVFHFGMSGQLRAPDAAPLVLSSSPKVPELSFPPRFTRLLLRFSDGGALAYADGRRLGRVWLEGDPASSTRLAKLGFDAATELPGRDELVELVSRRRGAVKALLLDQTFAAGVGNWIADEVLYQARIDPRRDVVSLSRKEILALRRSIRAVLDTAISVDADSTKYPPSWLFHHRWGKASGAKTARGEKVEFIEVGGRTTAWVPARQR
ncbi:MAG: hypothetical protein HY791_34755 [Deltaproteobacteria bacterium]|nr:hypothetical protein [Deltaproteobacteria bacterium]